MRYRFVPVPLLALPLLFAADAPKPKTFEVPYKTTLPKHIVVRAKINKKGPFNFILDTGAPAMIIATKAGEKAGLENGDDGWATRSEERRVGKECRSRWSG